MNDDKRRIWIIIGIIFALALALIPLSTLWGVRYDYTLTTVATGGAILGIVSGVLGCFAVLRRQSLMGDALSHAALPGVAIAFLIGGRELGILLVGAGVASWLAVLFINAITHTTRIKQDTAMGIVLAGFFAFGIALLTYIQGRSDASQAGLDGFIFGQAAAIVRQDIMLISSVGLVAFFILGLFWKEFKLITFDPEFAHANGFPIRGLDIALSTLIVVAIVLGLQLAGVILMVGMLIAPAVAARQWTHDLGQMVLLSAIFGGVSGASGAIISGLEANLPTGPLMIVVAFGLVTISLLFAPERGIVWTWYQHQRDQERFISQQILGDIYHHAMQHQDSHYPAPEGLLRTLRGNRVKSILAELKRAGLVQTTNNHQWQLTEKGLSHLKSPQIHQEGANHVYLGTAAD